MILVPFNGFTVTMGGNYSINSGEFDPVIMPDVPAEVEAEIEAGVYDYSNVHTYSAMSYKQLDGTLSIRYDISSRISWDGELIYSKFDDENGYVFGDETGSVYFIRSGLSFGL